MKKQLTILIVAAVVVGGAITAYAITNKNKTDANNTAGATTGSDKSMSDMPQGQGTQNSGASTDSTGAGSSNASSAVSTDQVKISNFAFSPASITVKVGTKVTWTNGDEVKHSVTKDEGTDGPSSQMLAKGDSYTYTFTKAGTFKYHCTPHPYMKGTVIVTE